MPISERVATGVDGAREGASCLLGEGSGFMAACYLLSKGSGPRGTEERCLTQETHDESREAGSRRLDQFRTTCGATRLVAVDLHLEPICRLRRDGDRLPLASAHDAIAGACQILRSAIGDLRDFIHHIDGLKYLLPAIDMHQDRKSAVAQAFRIV